VSGLMARWSWQKKMPFRYLGSFPVGANPTCISFMRMEENSNSGAGAPMPHKADGTWESPDPLCNLLLITVRGERAIKCVSCYEGAFSIYRVMKDQRMRDPVSAYVALRGPIVVEADFLGKQVGTFTIGGIGVSYNNNAYSRWYPNNNPANPGADWNFGGNMSFPGNCFTVVTVNVN
jgi:hypothetical protein